MATPDVNEEQNEAAIRAQSFTAPSLGKRPSPDELKAYWTGWLKIIAAHRASELSSRPVSLEECMNIMEEISAQPSTGTLIANGITNIERPIKDLGRLILLEKADRDYERKQKAEKLEQAWIKVNKREQALDRLEHDLNTKKRKLEVVEQDAVRLQNQMQKKRYQAEEEVKATERDFDNAKHEYEAAQQAVWKLQR